MKHAFTRLRVYSSMKYVLSIMFLKKEQVIMTKYNQIEDIFIFSKVGPAELLNRY